MASHWSLKSHVLSCGKDAVIHKRFSLIQLEESSAASQDLETEKSPASPVAPSSGESMHPAWKSPKNSHFQFDHEIDPLELSWTLKSPTSQLTKGGIPSTAVWAVKDAISGECYVTIPKESTLKKSAPPLRGKFRNPKLAALAQENKHFDAEQRALSNQISRLQSSNSLPSIHADGKWQERDNLKSKPLFKENASQENPKELPSARTRSVQQLGSSASTIADKTAGLQKSSSFATLQRDPPSKPKKEIGRQLPKLLS